MKTKQINGEETILKIGPIREKKKTGGIVPQENTAKVVMEAENDLNSSFTAKCK